MWRTFIGIVFAARSLAGPIAFEQFAVPAYHGKIAPPRVASSQYARRYRTVLRASAVGGPNFAGHFTVVTIGCGTSCARIAVVDAHSGEVFFPKHLSAAYWAGWWHEPYGPEFRLSSKLLVVHGLANSEDATYGVWYFVWNGQDFELLRFTPTDPGKP